MVFLNARRSLTLGSLNGPLENALSVYWQWGECWEMNLH